MDIIFDKLGEYIRKHNETKYLTLFHSDEKHEIFLITDILLC